MPPQVVPLIFGQSVYKKLEGEGGIKILYSSGYSWLLCVKSQRIKQDLNLNMCEERGFN